LKVNSIRKLKCSCGQNLRKSSRPLTPKVSITLCNIAVRYTGTVNVCTPNKCISDVSLQNSIDPTLSPVQPTVTTTTINTPQFSISQVNSEA